LARRLAANQHFRKILPGSRIEAVILQKLADWSPDQIAGWLKATKKTIYACAQTIYDWIYSFHPELKKLLHCFKGYYRRTRQARLRLEKRQQYRELRHISQRPSHIDQRKTYGHWEGDTIHGAGKSGCIATFVERKSGYLLAAKLSSVSCHEFRTAASRCFAPIPKHYAKTLTLDNGPEMRIPEGIERDTGLGIYFATPYHSWERGTNENTNGLLRYYFPKKTSFRHITQKDIDRAAALLNTRPRKRLGYRTPAQMFKY
jgi:IS30 family transposase